MNELPDYVQWGNFRCDPQPSRSRNARIAAWLVQGKRDHAQALVDRVLNRPSGGAVRYLALTAHSLLTFVDIERICSVHEGWYEHGYINEIDLTFWIPVLGLKKEFGVWLPDRIAWFIPYIVVSNDYTMVEGREVYGFPKTEGWFDLPKDFRTGDRFHSECLGLTDFGANTPVLRHPLVTVERVAGDGDGGGAGEDGGGLTEAIQHFTGEALDGVGDLLGSLPGVNRVTGWLAEELGRSQRMVFLNQFRDVAQPLKACYQAVVEAESEVTQVHGGGRLPGQYRMTLHHLASAPIADDLGLPGGTQVSIGKPAPPLVMDLGPGLWSTFDFGLGTGSEVWRG